MKFDRFWRIMFMFSVKVLHVSESIAVKFLNSKSLYIEPGRTLVLEAQFELQQNEQIMFSTWERKNSDGEVRLARNMDVMNNRDRTFVEKNGALLRLVGVGNGDYGVYTVTVTEANGQQVSDSRQVFAIRNPSTAFLAMKCKVLTQGTQWDSPRFSWQVDGVSITSNSAELSEDGSSLRLINLARNYTCVTDSSQGTSKVEVLLKDLPSEPGQCLASCCTGLIISVTLLSIVVLILVAVIIRLCYFRTTDTKEQPLNAINERLNSAQD